MTLMYITTRCKMNSCGFKEWLLCLKSWIDVVIRIFHFFLSRNHLSSQVQIWRFSSPILLSSLKLEKENTESFLLLLLQFEYSSSFCYIQIGFLFYLFIFPFLN